MWEITPKQSPQHLWGSVPAIWPKECGQCGLFTHILGSLGGKFRYMHQAPLSVLGV